MWKCFQNQYFNIFILCTTINNHNVISTVDYSVVQAQYRGHPLSTCFQKLRFHDCLEISQSDDVYNQSCDALSEAPSNNDWDEAQ